MAVVITNPGKFYGFILVFVGILVSLYFYVFIHGAEIEKTGDFTVAQGASSRTIFKSLVEEEYTSGQLALKFYSWRQEAAGRIQAGVYQLEVGEPVHEVMQRFVSGDTVDADFAITYPEGFTLDQIAERTAASGIGTKEEFMTLASDPAQFAQSYPFLATFGANRTLEGYLFPDTYRVFKDDTSRDVIERMLANFNRRVVGSGLVGESEKSLDEIVNMASIIEREVQTDDDMALVAGVLWKRIEIGEGLFADATIRYALNKPTAGLTVADLAVDSPYNTRLYRGLPPGPISNPGLRALQAAVTPEASDYLYYLSAPSGETIFAETNEEHNANKIEYLQ